MSKDESFLKKFLNDCKPKLKLTSFTICMGSEACDPDSFIASLVLAIHESAIPVINLNKEVFKSKGDMVYLCSLFNIEIDDLIFIEKPKGKFSLPARILGTALVAGTEEFSITNKKINLMLVDHHKPVDEFKHFELHTIIDHHELSESSIFARRIYVDIDVGSCCTLISKFIGHSLSGKKNPKNDHFKNSEINQHLAKMLSIPILLDTNRFKKVTSHFDRGEFRKLKKIAGIKKKEIKKIVKTIKKVRRNDDDLDTDIILQKDFKKFERDGIVFGYATIKYPLEKWIDREAAKFNIGNDKNAGIILETQFNTFRREMGLDFLLVNEKRGKTRYLAVVNCPVEKKLAETQGFKEVKYKGMVYYELSAIQTRKILTPVIKKMLHKLSISTQD